MTIQDLGSLGELIAAIATVGTLVYLAIQIRQNSRLLRATTAQAGATSATAFNTALASDRELLRLFVAGRQDLSGLDAADRDALTTLLIALFYNYESGFYQNRDGILHPEMWEGRTMMIGRLLQEEGTAEWWEQSKRLFGRSFRDFVDSQHAANKDLQRTPPT